MREVRRFFIPDSIVSITSVTKNREPFFSDKENCAIFNSTIEKAHEIHQFRLIAQVLLPDHFHWLLQTQSPDFSKVVKCVKGNFTVNYKNQKKIVHSVNIWQPRYWDHIIRDERDFVNHLEYIHWNPVKHGFVKEPKEWPYSSFSNWVNRGYYPDSWCSMDLSPKVKEMNFE